MNGNNNRIYYNIIDTVTNSPKKSVGVGQGIDLEGFGDCVSENNEIFNNVIANCDEAGIRVWVGDQVKKNNKIFNNIIYNCGKASVNGYSNCGLLVYNHDSIQGNTFRNNCIYNGGVLDNISYRGNRLTAAQLNASRIFPEDVLSGNISNTPLFTDQANGDFRLDNTSACKNQGVKHSILSDYYGSAVPQDTNVDIGIYEISVAAPKPPQNVGLE